MLVHDHNAHDSLFNSHSQSPTIFHPFYPLAGMGGARPALSKIIFDKYGACSGFFYGTVAEMGVLYRGSFTPKKRFSPRTVSLRFLLYFIEMQINPALE